MKSIILIVFFSYIIICTILYIFQREMLYFPTPYTKIFDAKEIYFSSDSTKLQGWVINEGKEKALIYYGGNAENIEHNINFFKELFQNHTVYLINYRGYGKSEGKPSQENIFKDASFIFDKVKQKYQKVSLMGRSLGSGVATYIASKKDIEKLVLITPYDSVLNVAKDNYGFVPVNLLLKDKYESTKYVKDIKAQTLIVYGLLDQIITPNRTENLIKEFNKEKLQVLVIKRANHNNIFSFNEYINALIAFFDD